MLVGFCYYHVTLTLVELDKSIKWYPGLHLTWVLQSFWFIVSEYECFSHGLHARSLVRVGCWRICSPGLHCVQPQCPAQFALNLPSPQEDLPSYGSKYGVKDPEGACGQSIPGLPGAYTRYRRKSMCRATRKVSAQRPVQLQWIDQKKEKTGFFFRGFLQDFAYN